ncbi:MAG: hypothetical protein A2Y45_08155 [Tenericutes bacterium GWC2_34_14]|nr:MAG: hypothetical protein A2Y45_08155 [Tenericutes bacterium GWC2_34_14]OHE34849.1 MAG: hypothetical protein A2012_01765 [Tenericutes bacterium GWE2_34_108]OHE37290.1 MAG: hypothetical protein A2Y46_01245 [Tenericutes bacterium GWF1_35_14]OHE39577.1 MAG: hypothetical protein A2Y44_01615 [Tenericutes bacterium GWF2_35_184]OHE43155.1 MAG: hypothetical protein A3K26_02990 [Tenericutes bacterium RIFOXYA12_FULL_35_10]OHE44234.1 MAG: hypothetical protein A2221_03895 [Tenericutes bacterium RIFOXYA
MNLKTTIESHEYHSFLKSLLYHLVPGIPIVTFYLLVAPLLLQKGLPAAFTLSIAVPIVLIPTQLLILYFHGYKKNHKLSIRGVLFYQDKAHIKDYVIYGLFIAIWSAIVFALLQKPIALFIKEHVVAFLPDWMLNDAFEGSRPILITTIILIMIFGSILGPVVEEFYFRGFLLPRIKGSDTKKVIVNSFLFALYHFWSPWDFIVRSIAVLPVAYTAVKKRNIYIGMCAHSLLNVLSSIFLFTLL